MSLAIEIASCAEEATGRAVAPFCFWNGNSVASAGLLNRRRSSVIMLLPPPRFCGTMFCGIAKGFGLTCTCIVSDPAVSRELDRRIGVSVGVFGDSTSVGKPLERGIAVIVVVVAVVFLLFCKEIVLCKKKERVD